MSEAFPTLDDYVRRILTPSVRSSVTADAKRWGASDEQAQALAEFALREPIEFSELFYGSWED